MRNGSDARPWRCSGRCWVTTIPTLPPRLNNLGITLQLEGKWKEAEATYREGLAIRTNRLGLVQS